MFYNDDLKNLDAWLEAPYQDGVADHDAFMDWAEMEGYDLDNPFEFVRAEQDYDYCMNIDAEFRAEAAYYDRLDSYYDEDYLDWEYDVYNEEDSYSNY